MQHLRIGITGGMGAGKSTICKIFKQLDIPVYDADSRAKWIMKNDPVLRKQIIESFGWDSYDRNDELNKEYLSKVVFNNTQKLEMLNSIVHPRVKSDYEEWVVQQASVPYSLKEAALLFESNSYKSLHKVIVVNSPIETRIERITQRDGVKREDILKRIQNQTTDRERMQKADWIIYNDGQRSLIEQAVKIHQEIVALGQESGIPFKQ